MFPEPTSLSKLSYGLVEPDTRGCSNEFQFSVGHQQFATAEKGQAVILRELVRAWPRLARHDENGPDSRCR
jgi:hypothetical protein